MRLIACANMAARLAPGVALAEHNGTYPTKSNSMIGSTAVPSPQKLPEQIENKMRQDGFTNVKVIPGSFLVSAKDKNGDNVDMVIGPNSIMIFTQSSGSTSATTGSGGQNAMRHKTPSK